MIYCCVNICRGLAVTMAPFLPASSTKVYGFLGLEGGPARGSGELRLCARGREDPAKPEILFKKIDDKEIARLKSTVTKSSDAAEFFKEG